MGFLPEAMINFLSLLGWSSPSGEEILSIDRLIDEIELERINKSAAIFDVEKFKWMNGQYIRSADIDRLTELAIPYLNDAGYPTDDYEITKQVVDATRKYLDHISQITDHVEVFFGEEVKFENDEAEELASKEESKQVYQAFLEELENYEELDGEVFKSIMKSIKKKTGAKGKNLWMPVRVGLTGEMHGPDLTLVVKILGGEGCKKRLKSVLD
jgi:nondiscriminating glutamyl-tRNA synthetase